jgi:hypothetical protein
VTSTEKIVAVGLIALWSGMEASLSLGNPVIQHHGATRATHGDSWTLKTGLATSDVSEDPGYRQLPEALGETPINEGDLVWVAGNKFVESYTEYIAAGGEDVLALGEWAFLGDGSAIRFGSALHFYRQSAALAKAALGFYEPKLVAAVHGRPLEGVFAARQVYVGCVITEVGERRLNDAFWFRQTENFNGYERAVIQAVKLAGLGENDVAANVDQKSAFYEGQFHDQLVDENEKLRTALADRVSDDLVHAQAAYSGVSMLPWAKPRTWIVKALLTKNLKHEMPVTNATLWVGSELSHILTMRANVIGKSRAPIGDNAIDTFGLVDND